MRPETHNPLQSWELLEAELHAAYSEPFARKATWLKHREIVRAMAQFAPTPREFDLCALSALATHWAAKVSPTTVNSKLRVVRCQLNFMEDNGYLERNPWRARKSWKVRIPKADPRAVPKKKHQSLEEVRRLLAQAAAEVAIAPTERSQWRARRLQSLIVFTLFSGVRAGEALHLRRSELDLDNNLAWVTEVIHRTKTESSVRMVPVADEAVAILRPWVESLTGQFVFPCRTKDTPWKHGSEAERPLGHVKALGERAGIPDVTLLSLRHTFTTHARQMMGLSREQVQAILGHSSPTTQDFYEEPDIGNIRQLARQIRFNVFNPDPKKETA